MLYQDKTRQDKTRQTNYGFLRSAFVKLSFFLFFLSLFLVLPIKAYAATYYVDPDGFDGRIYKDTVNGLVVPIGMALVDSKVWVIVRTDNYISVLNTDGTDNQLHIGSSLSTPYDLAVVGANVWVVNSGNNTITVLDTSGAVVTTYSGNGLNQPRGIAVVNNGGTDYVWVTNFNGSTISVFNTDGSAYGTPLSGNGMDHPYGITIVGSEVWVSNNYNGNISKFNADGSAIGTISTSGGSLSLDTVGSEIWVMKALTILRLDSSGNTLGTITGASWPGGALLVNSTKGTHVWVTMDNGNIYLYNTDGTDALNSSCSQAEPCYTMNRASKLANPGDTITLNSGTYNTIQSIYNVDGTSEAPITFTASGAVTITYPNPANAGAQKVPLLTIQGSNYLVFDGIEFVGLRGRDDWTPAAMSGGFRADGGDSGVSMPDSTATNITFQNVTVRDMDGNCVKSSTPYTTVQNSEIYNCGVNGDQGHYHGIYFSSHHATLYNTIIHDTTGWCAQAYPTSQSTNNADFQNNTTYGCYWGGLYAGYSDSAIFKNNIIYNNAHQGIQAGPNQTISNNLIVHNTSLNRIVRLNTNGTAATSTPITDMTLNSPQKMAVVTGAPTGTEVWIVNRRKSWISRYTTSGAMAGTPFSNSCLVDPRGIAVVGSEIWIASFGNNKICRFNSDGTSAGTAYSQDLFDMAVVGDRVWGIKSNGKIVVLRTNGTADSAYGSGGELSGNNQSSPYGIALVGDKVWETNRGNNSISVWNTDGTAAVISPITGNNLYAPLGVLLVGSEVWVANGDYRHGVNVISRFNTDGTSAGDAYFGDTADIANSIGFPSYLTQVGSEIWVSTGLPWTADVEIGLNLHNSNSTNSIYNNTLYENGERELGMSSPSGVTWNIKNNVIQGCNSTKCYIIYGSGSLPANSFDYNLFYNAVLPSSYGEHDITAQDPLFINPTATSFNKNNFALQRTSPAIDVGTDTGISTDLNEVVRPQGAEYDMGSLEYIPLTVTVEQANDQNDPTNSSTIDFTVTFSESVSDFASGDVTLSGTASPTTAVVTGSGTTYNVAVSGMSDDGTVIASLVAGVATGATGNTNNASISTDNTVTYDTTAPTLTSITISDTSGYTNDSTPTINIVSSGSPSHIAFSCNGGANWSSWITYADSISSFNITNGATGCNTTEGSKTITAKLKDAAGNESSTTNDSTYYDASVPTGGSISINSGSSNTKTRSVTLTISATGATYMMISENSDFSGASWEAYSTSKNYDLSTEDGTKTVYIKFKDDAENTTDSYSDSITYDSTSPTSFDLDSPGDSSYTNSERPTFKWKAASNPDSGSGLSKYVLEIDNPSIGSGQPSGDFTIDDIPTSRTTDYETNKYVIHYENFSDSDSTNNYISVYTKSHSDWGSSENDGKLREGKISWKVKAVDNVGNTTEASRTLFVDRTNPKAEFIQINSTPFSSINFSTTDKTPTIFGKITDSLAGADNDGKTKQDENGPKVASGPKQVEIKIEKKDGSLYKTHTIYTINMDKPWYTCDNKEVSDNSKQKCDKYLPFEYTPSQNLDLGTYKITITGKDKADNTSSSTSFTLNITTLAQYATPDEKQIIDEELKDLQPKEQEIIKEELELTKPEATPSATKQEGPNRIEIIIGGFKNFWAYIKEVAEYGGQTIGQGLKKTNTLFIRSRWMARIYNNIIWRNCFR